MPDKPYSPEMASSEGLGKEERPEEAEKSVEGKEADGSGESLEGAVGVLKKASEGDEKESKVFGSSLLGDIVKRGEKLFGKDKTSALEEEVRDLIGGVDKEVGEETERFLDIIENISHESGEVSRKEPSKKEVLEKVESEVVFHNGEWLKEDVGEETKEWLNGKGHPETAEDFTEEEKKEAEEYRQKIYEETTKRAEEDPGTAEILKELFDKEGDVAEESAEALKLLLRIAVKVGTKLAASIAKNISKDKEVPQEIRIMMGVFADSMGDVGKFADKMIAGDSKANLEQDIIDFINDKRN